MAIARAFVVLLLGSLVLAAGCRVRPPLAYPRSAEIPSLGRTRLGLDTAYTDAGLALFPQTGLGIGLGGGCTAGGELGTVRALAEARCRAFRKRSLSMTLAAGAGADVYGDLWGEGSARPVVRGGFELTWRSQELVVGIVPSYVLHGSRWEWTSFSGMQPPAQIDASYSVSVAARLGWSL